MRTRQEIAAKVLADMRERGLVIDGAPEVVSLIDDWAAGLIEMPECRERYVAIVRQREAMRRARLHPLVGETILQLDETEATPLHAARDSEMVSDTDFSEHS